MVPGYVVYSHITRQAHNTCRESSRTSTHSSVYWQLIVFRQFSAIIQKLLCIFHVSLLCHTVTNVVFSNGRLDPWSEMGVVDQDRAGAGVKVVMMDQAAHHLDLFFEHPLDPQDVLDARRVEMDMVESWVDQAYRVYRGESASHGSGGDGNIPATGGGRNDLEAHEAIPCWLERVPSLTADW